MTYSLMRSSSYGLYSNSLPGLANPDKCGDSAAAVGLRIGTTMNILGWIPVIGMVVGAIRLCSSCAMPDKKAETGSMIRSVVELTNAGCLLIPIDVAVTCMRARIKQ